MLWCDSHEWCCKFLDHGCTSSRTRKIIASGLHIASVHPLDCTSMSLAWTGPVPTPLFLRIGHRARSANWSMRIWQRFVLSILTVCHLLVRIFRLCSHLHITCQSVRICEPKCTCKLTSMLLQKVTMSTWLPSDGYAKRCTILVPGQVPTKRSYEKQT